MTYVLTQVSSAGRQSRLAAGDRCETPETTGSQCLRSFSEIPA